MTALMLTVLQTVVIVLLAPLATGFVRKVKARLQGRLGAPVTLPYWTIATLMRKEIVLSTSTTWVFRVVPFMVLGTALLPAAILPLISRGGAGAPLSNLVVVAGVWMLGAVFLVLGGLDSASAFGGMGFESRDDDLVVPRAGSDLCACGLGVLRRTT